MISNILQTIRARMAARREERGASAVEYGLLIAGIAALIVVAVFALGPVVKDAFSSTCKAVQDGSAAGGNAVGAGEDCTDE